MLEHALVPAMFGEHLHIDAETPDFGGLSNSPPQNVAAAEALLRRRSSGCADAPRRARRITKALDRAYLQTIGRFVQDDSELRLVLEHDGIVEQLAAAESHVFERPHRSILVVGESRSGKTSFLMALTSRAAARGWPVFEAGAASLMAGQQYIGQLEERVQRLVSELAAEKQVLWYVPDFLPLATGGKHQYQTASLLDQLLPAIASGRIVMLSETTPAALTALLQNRPAVRSAVELIRLQAMSDDRIDRFARDFATRLSAVAEVEIEPEVLDTATHLARPYLGTGEMPGAALDLLKLTAQRVMSHGASDGDRMRREDVLTTLSQLTGMPALVLDDRERIDLQSLRAFFSARVIGQDEAIDAVVDRIAMLKAGLTDPGGHRRLPVRGSDR